MQCRRGHDYAINNVCCEGETGGETSGRKEEQGEEDIDSTADTFFSWMLLSYYSDKGNIA